MGCSRASMNLSTMGRDQECLVWSVAVIQAHSSGPSAQRSSHNSFIHCSRPRKHPVVSVCASFPPSSQPSPIHQRRPKLVNSTVVQLFSRLPFSLSEIRVYSGKAIRVVHGIHRFQPTVKSFFYLNFQTKKKKSNQLKIRLNS